MALSDDGEDDELLQELQGVRDGPDKRRKRGESKKSVGRQSGGKRSKAFEAPLPLEYKKTDDGRFQKLLRLVASTLTVRQFLGL